jgi:putative DNA methylase
MTAFADVFTDRQLEAMNTLVEEIANCRARIITDAKAASMPEPDAVAYANAVTTYLGLALSRVADMNNSLVQWSNARDQAVHLFGRQAIPMVWDFAEVAPFAGAAGDFAVACSTQARAIEGLRPNASGCAYQQDATALASRGVVVTTDPPYYDNIGYADLSDFFYVWLRRSVGSIYPDLTGTLLTPKLEELVAAPDRFNGKRAAETHFRDGLQRAFEAAAYVADDAAPVVFFYAFKQAEEVSEGTVSTGWETMLSGLLRAGFAVVATWPMRTERDQGLKTGTNVLASSVVLVCRRRSIDTRPIDRREFLARLRDELPQALRDLQQASIAPVDLAQAAIGPGMAVFSRYPAVLEEAGDPISVRAALAAINGVLDEALSAQESDFDATTRFAIAWYRQHGYGAGKFGDADVIARALNTAVDSLDRDGVLTSRAGKVQLISPEKLSEHYDPLADLRISNWEALHHLIKVLERDGIARAGDFLQAALSRPDGIVDPDLVKELAHLLFRIAEGIGWAKDALSFNNLVTSWPEILDLARSEKRDSGVQRALDFEEGDD